MLPDGSVLRCKGPGRPTRDVLFSDVNRDGKTALKLWNLNAVTGVLGVFNVQGARWDLKKRAFVTCDEPERIRYVLRPSDVEGIASAAPRGGEGRAQSYALYSHRARRLQLLRHDEAHAASLGRREWELFAVSPIRREGGVRWAPLGLMDMLNGGGAIVSSKLSSALRLVHARVTLRASGTFSAYCQPPPLTIKINGVITPFTHDAETGMLTVAMEVSESSLFSTAPQRACHLSSEP